MTDGAVLTATVGIGHGILAAAAAADGVARELGPLDEDGRCWCCRAGDAAGVDPV